MHAARNHGAHPPPSRWLVGAALAAVYVIWGTTYFAIKVGVEGVGPFFLIGTRFVVAGALLFVVLWLRGAPLPAARQWRHSALMGVLMLVLGIGLTSAAVQWISSGATVALISVLPVVTALWSGVLGQWPGRREWMAILVGAVGALVMVVGRDLAASPLGTFLILCAVASCSFGSTVARRLDLPPGAMGFAAEMLAGGAIALVVSAALGEAWTLPQSPRVWWAWIYLIGFGSLIAFSAYRFLIDRVSPTLASTYAYANPPVALFVGWALGDETFSLNTFIGLPIVLGAVALHAWVQLRTQAASVPASPEPQIEPTRSG